MKKGLLSILAGALVVVGCQNYDDQFDNLESQISALASTVAGLSQVQSDLASLSGTVASLASTVNGLGSQIDTAVSNGLADIQADIDAIEAAVADVASSEAVDALADAVADAQTDLTDLLEASSVFTGDVVVNSVNTLDAFHKMGAALNIVNGNVTITVSTDMDQAKVQELVDNIFTVVKDLTYTSAASSIAETTFDNLTGVQSITITQGGGIRFPNLVSATNIDMKDDFESTVEVIHFGALTSVTAFKTDATSHVIEFNKATELHLTSLEYYPGGTLTITTDEGAAMPFALDDIDADGDTLENGLTLTITGPASFSTDKIADGTFDFTDVASINLTDYKGAVTIGGDVNSFTSNSLVSLSVDAGTKIETVDVTGVADPDATSAAPSYGPTINLDTLGDLETVTIAGIAASVNLGSNNNLTDITISADVAGSITIDNNSDLTSITLTGAKATALDVDTNADLASLTVDLTWRAGTATDAKLDGDLDVTDNASLESLTVSSDNLENLEVTGNDELTTIDFTGVTKIGATGTAVVNIYDNDLSATKLTDSDDGATDAANGKSGDLGSVTSTSGMSTLKTYLTAVAADADSAAAVYFDTVESFVAEDDTETTDVVYSSNTAQNAGTVLLLVANTASPGTDSTKMKRAFVLNGDCASCSLDVYANGTRISVKADGTAGSFVTDANPEITIAQLTGAAATTRATAAGVTVTATLTGRASAIIYLSSQQNSATDEASLAAAVGPDTNTNIGSGTIISFTVGSLTVTTSTSSITSHAGDIQGLIKTAYEAITATREEVTLTESTDTAGNGVLLVEAKDIGSEGILNLAVTLDNSGIVSTTTDGRGTLGVVIGATSLTTDNSTKGMDIVYTIENNVAGTILNNIGTVSSAAASATLSLQGSSVLSQTHELTTTRQVLAGTATATADDAFVSESRADVRIAEDGAPAAASNAVSFSRVGWL